MHLSTIVVNHKNISGKIVLYSGWAIYFTIFDFRKGMKTTKIIDVEFE